MKNELRNKSHRRYNEVETMLQELKQLLEAVDDNACSPNLNDRKTTVHILGCARSGTTLLHQLLVRRLQVSYPTNFLSRFFYAPVIGAKLQFLLNDLDFNDEVLSSFPDFEFSSKLGKTKGPLSPHEFWYFWRNIFGVDENGLAEEINQTTLSEFYNKVDNITSVFGRPFVLKSMIAQHKISEFTRFRPEDKIIFIKRQTEFNAQSLLQARKEYFNDINQWYSFKPLNYQISGSPYQQVVEQVIRTNEMIESDLCNVDPKSIFTVNYEEINDKFDHLIQWLGFEKRNNTEPSISTFTPRNMIRDNQEFEKIMNWINER